MFEDTQARHAYLPFDRLTAPLEPVETKRCKTCRQTLPLDRFSRRDKGGQGVAANCKECVEHRYQTGMFGCNRCGRKQPGPKFVRGSGGRPVRPTCKECTAAGTAAATELRRLKAGKPPHHYLNDINEQERNATCTQCGPVHIYPDKTAKSGWRCGPRSDEVNAERCAARAKILGKYEAARWHRIRNVRSADMIGTCSLCGDVPVKWCRTSGSFKCDSPARKRSQADKRRVKRWREKYGLTPDDYDRMNEEQDGRCAICGGNRVRSDSDGKLFVDHDHVTGAVRALLCSPCNSGLGHFGDNPEFLRAAAVYLESYRKDAAA